MGGHIAGPRAGGGHVHKTKQRGLQGRVAREQLHPAVLERARAAAAGGGLPGGDPPAELAHALLRSEPAGAERRGGRERASSFAPRRYALASSVTIVSRPEFLRRLFNPG